MKLVRDIKSILGVVPKCLGRMETLFKAGTALACLNRQYNVKRRGLIPRAVDCGVSTVEFSAQR